jgi:hypothetical protein
VYFTRSNICQHGSREAASQGELFLYKTSNLSSAGAVLNEAAIGTVAKCKMGSPCVGCSSCFHTQRNKCLEGEKGKRLFIEKFKQFQSHDPATGKLTQSTAEKK